MNDVSGSALRLLGDKLCPWLEPALAKLEAARAADRFGHAWLIAGPSGIGKTNLALVFANGVLEARNRHGRLSPSEFLRAMRERHAPADRHPDLHWVFPEEDKQTISIEQIRAVCEAIALKPYRGASKVVIIEPAEGLTAAAANALLKTLEEPAGDTYLLLVSHQPGRLPPTIRSRCQRIDVRRPRPAEIADWVGAAAADIDELWEASGGAPLAIAELGANGSFLENSNLEHKVVLISKGEIDPQAVADEWTKLDVNAVLAWLLRRLSMSIRARVAGRRATAVTDLTDDALHNAWATLGVETLFRQYEAADRLLNQIGTGVNIELGLRSLLLGFAPNRGRE
jgi:DNA polymerase-3 subunit delta'